MAFLGLTKLNFIFSGNKNESLVANEKIQPINFTKEQEEAKLACLEAALYGDDNEGICNLGLYC